MDNNPSEQKPSGINRRRFIGTMGGAAAAAAFLQRGGGSAKAAASEVYYYQDSFGNIAPAGSAALDLGIYPPPIPSAEAPSDAANVDSCGNGTAGTTWYACEYPQYNILLVIVDQMRNPAFWIPAGNTSWQSAYANVMPNLVGLANQSFVFPDYFVAATVCTPSRACLLTGLYSQQTGIFGTGGYGQTPVPPPLLPYNPSWSAGNNAGFPTIGNVLSQAIPVGNSSSNISYDCTWIGKWHLSCASGVTTYGLPGENGPSDYGFGSAGNYNIPTTNAFTAYPAATFGQGYASPNGDPNGGTGGDFLDSQIPAHNCPSWNSTLSYSPENVSALNDAAIALAFTRYWLTNANNAFPQQSFGNQISNPWFCAVSLINPHDMSDFPWPFPLTTGNSYFTAPSNPVLAGYQPPPILSYNNTYPGNNCSGGSGSCSLDGDEMTIQAFQSVYSNLPPSSGNTGHWNYEYLSSMPYSNNGKPGLQQWFQGYLDDQAGTIGSPGTYNTTGNNWSNPGPWQTFLNYYLWLQSCVDYQIGQVLGTTSASNNATYPGLKQYPTFWANTVIIFTSDHGDYGGSHGLHAKGGGLYDEVMNVPLFISYPQQRNNTSTQTAPIYLPYACSSVDMLPFLYTLALGNHSWRTNANDMITYLGGRESINDAISGFPTVKLQQRRISGIPLASPYGSNDYQPFVLHTCDETLFAPLGNNNNYQPPHAIAIRTVDVTLPNT